MPNSYSLRAIVPARGVDATHSFPQPLAKWFLSRGIHRDAQCVALARSYLIGLMAAFGHATVKRRPFLRFVRKRVEEYLGSGRDKFLPVMKSRYSELQTLVLSGRPVPMTLRSLVMPRSVVSCNNEIKLLQLSKLKRALPAIIDRTMIASALEEWADMMTQPASPAPVPELVRIAVERVVRSLGAIPAPKDLTLSSSSACLGFTRREGGRNAALAQCAPKSARTQVASYLTSKQLPEINAIRKNVDKISVDVRRQYDALESVVVEPLMVSELGPKLRVVEKAHFAVVSVADATRKVLFPSLRKLSPQVCLPVSVDTGVVSWDYSYLDPDRIEFTSPEAGFQVFSGDLTKATDLLSNEALSLVCDLLSIDRRLVSEVQVLGKSLPTRHGTPMGLPIGWTLMTILHYAVASVVDPKLNFRIKGDDIIALWTLSQIAFYKRLGALVGLHSNEKGGTGPRLGTFCEAEYRLEGTNLIRLPTFSIRSFVSDSPLPPQDWQSYLRRGVRLGTLRGLQKFSHKKWIFLAKQHHVPLTAPPKLGGLGFVTKPSAPCDSRTCQLATLANNGQLQVERPLGRTKLSKYVSSFHSKIQWSCQPMTATFDPSRIRAAIDRSVARASVLDAMVGSFDPKPLMTPARVVKALAKMRARAGKDIPVFRLDNGTAYQLISRLRPTIASCLTHLRKETLGIPEERRIVPIRPHDPLRVAAPGIGGRVIP